MAGWSILAACPSSIAANVLLAAGPHFAPADEAFRAWDTSPKGERWLEMNEDRGLVAGSGDASPRASVPEVPSGLVG